MTRSRSDQPARRQSRLDQSTNQQDLRNDYSNREFQHGTQRHETEGAQPKRPAGHKRDSKR